MQFLLYQATASCPDGWKMISSKCYKASRFVDKMNFQAALEQCNNMNATLAEPMNKEENSNLATNFNVKLRYWIGISDQETEGTFKYVSDASEVEFTSWAAKQPNNKWPKLDCTAFKNGKWNTANCGKKEFPYICQMDMEPPSLECPSGLYGFPECDDGE